MSWVVLGILASLQTATPQTDGAPASWTEPVEPFAIAEGFYYVGTAELASFLMTSDKGHALIDAPLAANVDLILENVRRLGFDPSDVNVLLASQAHFDHVGGLARMMEVTGADLVLSKGDSAVVASGGALDGAIDIGFTAARATRTIGHLETVAVGNQTLTAHLTPGHTRGCTTWSGSVEVAGRRRSFVSVCSLSVLPTHRLVGPAQTYPGIGRDFCASLAHLRTLKPDIFLAPHGEMFGLTEKRRSLASGSRGSFVDPDSYGRYLDLAQQAIERALTEQGHRGGCATLTN